MKITLAKHNFKQPPIKEVRKQLRLEIESKVLSFRETDGVVRDKTVIYEILCLQQALLLLPRR